ncbi:transketolase family protein [Halobacteriota archaeon]
MIEKSTRDAYGECLAEIGAKEERIVVLDADLSTSTKTSKFAERYPKRFFNVGCAEQDLIGTAAGLAYSGKIAFASSYAIFATGRAWEQIRSIVAHDNLDVKIVVSHAGLSNGPDGASHQSLEDIALMRVIPNMQVIVPADAEETKQAICAIVYYPGPFYVRLSRIKTPILFDSNYQFELGKGITLREGSDLTIIATGTMVSKALDAADDLNKEGIDARVINIHTIKPIDTDIIIKAARETGAIITVEEHSILGGLGGAVAETIVCNEVVPMEFVAVRDRFGQSGDTNELYELYSLTTRKIVESAKKVLK